MSGGSGTKRLFIGNPRRNRPFLFGRHDNSRVIGLRVWAGRMNSLDAIVLGHELVQELLREGYELRDHPERAGARRVWCDRVGEQWRKVLSLFNYESEGSYGAVWMMRTWFAVARSSLDPALPLGDHDVTRLLSLLEALEVDLFAQRRRLERVVAHKSPAAQEAVRTADVARAAQDEGVEVEATRAAPGEGEEDDESSSVPEPVALRSLHEDKQGAFVAITETERFRFTATALAPLNELGRRGSKGLYLDLTSGEVGSRSGGAFSLSNERLSATQCLLVAQVVLSPGGVAADELYVDPHATIALPRQAFTKACQIIEPGKAAKVPYKIFPNLNKRYTFVPPDGGHLILVPYKDIQKLGLRW